MKRLTFDDVLIAVTIAMVAVAVLAFRFPVTLGIIVMAVMCGTLAGEAIFGIGFGEISVRALCYILLVIAFVIGLAYFFAPERTGAALWLVVRVAGAYLRR